MVSTTWNLISQTYNFLLESWCFFSGHDHLFPLCNHPDPRYTKKYIYIYFNLLKANVTLVFIIILYIIILYILLLLFPS